MDYLRGRPDGIRVMNALSARGADMFLTPLILFELYRGVSRAPNARTEALKVEKLRQEFRIIPFEAQAARLAGQMAEHLRKEGAEVAVLDVLIAASSIVWGDGEIVTNDTSHFLRLRRFGLVVRSS